MQLSDLLPARFNPPATELDIRDAETALGVGLPDALARLYRQANGFREPLGNTPYLFPLSRGNLETDATLVSSTHFWWREWRAATGAKAYPGGVDFRDYVFFGSSSADESWAIRLDGHGSILVYHHHLGDAVDWRDADIPALFLRDQQDLIEIDQLRFQ
jgi:SMI1 / KNR4 family (SUKH-1)